MPATVLVLLACAQERMHASVTPSIVCLKTSIGVMCFIDQVDVSFLSVCVISRCCK